jgi:hypothetical protein
MPVNVTYVTFKNDLSNENQLGVEPIRLSQ